jgi:hypothetical protein
MKEDENGTFFLKVACITLGAVVVTSFIELLTRGRK